MFFAFAPSGNSIAFVDRAKAIWQLLFYKKPKINLTPTTQVIFGENTIYFTGDFHLNTTGNMYLTAQKHVVIQSGQDAEPDRPGYRHSVWINSKLDNFGRPLQSFDPGLLQSVLDNEGKF
jgi:hypothetical protein